MNSENNMSNNQVPATGNVSTNNNTVPGNGVTYSANQNQSMTQVPVQNTVPSPQGNVAVPGSSASNAYNVAVTPSVSSVDIKEQGQTQTTDNSSSEHEVTHIISSSFEKKDKVNLLTPEQRAELTKKREDAMKEKLSYQPAPVSKTKKFFSVFIIVLLFAVVLFLPDIYVFIGTLKGNELGGEKEIITTGTLRCTNDLVDDKYNISYTYSFDFTESKLEYMTVVLATTGDELVDADDLNQKLASCELLKSMTSEIGGVYVSCSLSSGTLTKEQSFDYGDLNKDYAITAYTEAGGDYPGEFEANASIDTIEKNMKAAGYSCERFK